MTSLRRKQKPAFEGGGAQAILSPGLSLLLPMPVSSYLRPIIAAKSNRMAGKFAQATPATKVRQVIEQLAFVFDFSSQLICSNPSHKNKVKVIIKAGNASLILRCVMLYA